MLQQSALVGVLAKKSLKDISQAGMKNAAQQSERGKNPEENYGNTQHRIT